MERLISGSIMSFAQLEAALSLAVAVGARAGVVIDSGCRQVHQQYAEGHAIRIAAPGADDVDQNADANTEDETPERAGGAADRIGDDEERAEIGRAACRERVCQYG